RGRQNRASAPGELFRLPRGKCRRAFPRELETRHVADSRRRRKEDRNLHYRRRWRRRHRQSFCLRYHQAGAIIMTRREWIAMISAAPLLKGAETTAPTAPVAIGKCASYDEDLTAPF